MVSFVTAFSGLLASAAFLLLAASWWRDGKTFAQAALNFSRGSMLDRASRLMKLGKEAREILLEAETNDP